MEAFQKVFETLEERGMKPTLNITDNQAVKPINPFFPLAAPFFLQVLKSPVFHLIQSGPVNDHQTTPIPPN